MCQKSSKTMGANLELGPVTIIPDDVSGRRERPIRPQTSSTFQQGERERLSGATRQSSTPPPEPCPSCCSSHFTGLRPGPRSSQLPEERVGLVGPSSSCLARKHHESGPSVFTRQLWVGTLFGATGLVQSGFFFFFLTRQKIRSSQTQLSIRLTNPTERRVTLHTRVPMITLHLVRGRYNAIGTP